MQRIAASIVIMLLAAHASWADGGLLDGMPTYVGDPIPGDPLPSEPQDLSAATLAAADQRPERGTPLGGVPDYRWWYGCSPTSCGMMVGFWDGQPGRGNLYHGDASVWSGDGSSGTRSMVASTAHITAGSENGYTYGDWHNSASYPNHEANPDCIADFIKTVNGGSSDGNIRSGLEGYCEWDNPATPVNEAYDATAVLDDVGFWGGAFNYQTFKNEIDAGRPVLLNVVCAEAMGDWVGHSVVGYGYQDDMFQVKVPVIGGGSVNLTVGGFAVMDTWSPGTAASEWVGWDATLVDAVIDGESVEWWPFVEFLGASWVYSEGYGPYDWMVDSAVTLTVVPEPATIGLVGLGLAALAARKRR